jgi:hypothetical protein
LLMVFALAGDSTITTFIQKVPSAADDAAPIAFGRSTAGYGEA